MDLGLSAEGEVCEDDGEEGAGGQGDGEADEVCGGAAALGGEDVEAGESEDAAGGEGEGDEEAGEAEAVEAPAIDEEGGGEAEGDGVGEAVELDAELALAFGGACDASIAAIEEHAQAEEVDGADELLGAGGAGGDDHGVEGGEDAGEGDEVGEDVAGVVESHLQARLLSAQVGRVCVREGRAGFGATGE